MWSSTQKVVTAVDCSHGNGEILISFSIVLCVRTVSYMPLVVYLTACLKKPGYVGEFDSCLGNVGKFTGSQRSVGG